MDIVCCQIKVPVTDRSLVQRSPTECGVSECDCEASIMGPTMGCCAMGRECTVLIPRHFGKVITNSEPISVAARSKAWVCGWSLAGIVGSNLVGVMDVCLL